MSIDDHHDAPHAEGGRDATGDGFGNDLGSGGSDLGGTEEDAPPPARAARPEELLRVDGPRRARLLGHYRTAMVGALRSRGIIRSDAVTDAMLAVAREEFLPGTAAPELVYDELLAHVTDHDAHGRALSSICAPWLQARMLEQAALAPGMRVLEIGSGGYNAALIAHIVGPTGHVTTLDINPDVITRIRDTLRRLDPLPITTVHGDATTLPPTPRADSDQTGTSDTAGFDRIVVTAATDDIPPSWPAGLTPGGRLVVPLRLLRTTRSVALTRHDGRLGGDDTSVCSFPVLRGRAAHPTRRGHHDPSDGRDVRVGHDLLLRIGPSTHLDTAPDAPGSDADSAGALGRALLTAGETYWSGFEVDNWSDTDTDEYLPLAVAEHDVGLLVATSDVPVDLGRVDHAARRGAPCLIQRDSLAYRVLRRAPRPRHQELGVIAHGPHGSETAARLLFLLGRWHAQRHLRPRVEVWPAGTPDHALPTGHLIERPHSRIVVTWNGSLL